MTEDELLELLERVYSNLDATIRNAVTHQDPWEDHVLDFNSNLQRLIEAGVDVREWLIQESLIQPSYGQRKSSSGEYVQLKRITSEEFLRRANPAMKFLGRETKRRRALVGGTSMTQQAPIESPEIWVIFGQDRAFKEEICDLLTQVGLRPIDFKLAVRRSGSGSPHTLEVVINAIQSAPAVVALWSPDEMAELREDLRSDPTHWQVAYQPRPNVLIETGMALAAKRDRTIVVRADDVRDPSDTLGIHYVKWSDDPDLNGDARHDLVHRLEVLGCPVDTKSTSTWMRRRK